MKKRQYIFPQIEIVSVTMNHLMESSMTFTPVPPPGAPRRNQKKVEVF